MHQGDMGKKGNREFVIYIYRTCPVHNVNAPVLIGGNIVKKGMGVTHA